MRAARRSLPAPPLEELSWGRKCVEASNRCRTSVLFNDPVAVAGQRKRGINIVGIRQRLLETGSGSVVLILGFECSKDCPSRFGAQHVIHELRLVTNSLLT